MKTDIKSAVSRSQSASDIVADLSRAWEGFTPTAIVFFASHALDGAQISARLRTKFPKTPNIGCTTAGELTQSHDGRGTVSALALGPSKVTRAAAALASFGGDVGAGVRAAMNDLSRKLDVDLRHADAKRYVGLTLVEGLKRNEEECNEALGDAAPLLTFVGGSAGDDGAFQRTRVFVDGVESDNGAALLVLDCAVPFVIGKTCSFAPTGTRFVVTRADAQERIVYELDGKPAAEVYARATGVEPQDLDASLFMTRPIGLMIDGAPWIRSPQQLLDGGALRFYCRVEQGTAVDLMRSTDLVEDTRASVARSAAELGRPISGGLVFNCILRRLEIDAKGLSGPFLSCFSGLEAAGFHTYGESLLAHINQTLTALWFG